MPFGLVQAEIETLTAEKEQLELELAQSALTRNELEELRELSLDVPGTVDLLYELRRIGWDVPLDALGVDECADVICKYLQ